MKNKEFTEKQHQFKKDLKYYIQNYSDMSALDFDEIPNVILVVAMEFFSTLISVNSPDEDIVNQNVDRVIDGINLAHPEFKIETLEGFRKKEKLIINFESKSKV